MAKGANQKLKLLYLIRIFQEKTDDDHGITMQEIINSLAAYGVTAERKSLYDDFETLGVYGIDINKTQHDRNVYYSIGSREFEVPELKLLVDAVQSSKFITQKKSEELIGKLEKLTSVYEAVKLRRQVYVHGRIKTMNESIYYAVDAIHEAIAGNNQVRFQYFQWNVKKEQELKQQQEALHIDEQNQQSRYQQLCEERKQLEHDKAEFNKKEQKFEAAKDSMEVRYQVQIEKAKNMEIQAKQTKESFEHKLDMLGLILDADGKPGGEATQFFESLLSGMNKENEEDLQSLEKEKKTYENENRYLKAELEELNKKRKQLEEEKKQLEEEKNQLQSEKKQLSEDVKRMEAEKNRLLALVSSISQKKKEVEEPEREEEDVPNFGTSKEEEEDVPNSDTQEEKNVPNFGTEETYIPTFGRKQEQRELQREKPVFEELTASILNRYLARNEPKYISSEIRHSEDGEQLHVNINNLDYVFLFSQPAAFDISAPKKKSRALDKLLVRLNTQHPGVKFYYDEQEHRVYASGYFSNTMSPERLMEKVHEVSDCFRQK